MQDLFYLEQFKELKQQYPDTFYYHLVVSRDEAEGMIQK
jgi:Na+-transporting NADH:ubiquinone oxidoreductase subunit NqrF